MHLTEFSIKHHMAVLVGCVGILAIGIYAYLTMPRESFPDIEFPFIIVTTVLDGATPTDVEESVTIPLETEIDGLEGMKEMRSSSLDSLSTITVEFVPGVPVEVALSRVRDRVDQAQRTLSPQAEKPVVKEFSLTSIPVLIYQLVSLGEVSLSELDELAEKIEDDLRMLPEVLDVDRFGGRQREIVIEVDPERLHFYALPLEQVQNVVRGSNRNLSAGVAESSTSRIMMRVPGEFKSPGEIMDLVIGAGSDGTPIYLRDVGIARYGFKDETSRSRLYDFSTEGGDGPSLDQYVSPNPAVSIQVMKRTGANILDLADKADGLIAEYPFPEGVRAVKSLDQSKFVRMMVGDLESGIGTSLILVLLVIFVGLGMRNAFMVASAIPFSMLLAVAWLSGLGDTLNMMVLFGLILALGMLVDNAIVIVESIYRHHSLGVPRGRAALLGASEVSWPVIASTATTVAAFFPLLFWPGIMGQFMGFLPRTVILVLLCSLLVALVINPTIAAMIMKVKAGARRNFDPESQRPDYWLVRRYRRVLEFVLDRPAWTLATAVLLLVLVFALHGLFGAGVEFFPEIEPDELTCTISPPEGVSLEESDRISRELEERLFGAPGSGWDEPLRNLKFASVVVGLEGVGGGGNMFFGGGGPIRVSMEFVDTDYRTEPTTETLSELRRRIEGLAPDGRRLALPLFAAEYDVARPQAGPPRGRPVAVEIFGRDLNQMARVIHDMRRLIEETPGTVKAVDDAVTAQTTLEWNVDRARAGMLGLTQPMVGAFLQVAVGGLKAGTFGHGDDEQDIMLRFPPEYRLDSERLKNITVPVAGGAAVPIVSVANAELVPGPVAIKRFNRRRVLTAESDVQPWIRADATVRAEFQEKVRQYRFPAGISYGFGQADAEQMAAVDFLVQAFGIAVFLIMLVLVLQFNSVLMALIVMCSVALSLMGVFVGLLVMGAPFGIVMTGIGCISLAGVVVNNAIVMLDAIQKFERRGEPVREAIVSAGMIRFRPVLLTAITTILGLLPMALKLNFDFRRFRWQYDTTMSQFWQSMASSVIFGLLVATVLTLAVVPALYYMQARFRQHITRERPLLNHNGEAADPTR